MEIVLTAFVIIIAGFAIVRAFKKMGELYFNIRALKQKPDVTKQRTGIVFNEKTNELEADNAIVTPFR